ncbi:hypothetical protein [Mycobacterium sp.]|uniref:hypothetical protein n=1 Tax=Mycobacterium sp. TaxID=1785 RepID=UPI003D0A0377
MAAVHCHFPITVHVTGHLGAEALYQLAAEVERAVAERIASAETELYRHPGARAGTGVVPGNQRGEASTGLAGADEIARRPAGTRKPVASAGAAAAPGQRFLIHVTVNEPVSAAEFCFLAVMQGLGLERDEAKRVIDSGTLRCYGWASTYGVGPEWVNHPIPFWVESRLAHRAAETPVGSISDVALEPGELAEISAEADQRFWAKIGEYRTLSKTDPRDAAYRELWKSEYDALLRERHPIATGGEPDDDPFSADLRRFVTIAGLPTAAPHQEIDPEQMYWMQKVQEILAGISERDWKRLQRIGLPQSDWQGLSAWVSRFVEDQRALDHAIEKVGRMDEFGGLDSAYESIRGEGRGSRDDVEGEAYARSSELDEAAGAFRDRFQVRAVEITLEMLRYAEVALETVRERMHIRRERESLFSALANNDSEVLARDPALSYPDILESAHNSTTPDDLGERLRGSIYQQIERIKFVRENLDEKPNVVFNFDVVVANTLVELGLGESIHAEIIKRGWGSSDGSSLFEKLLELGKMLLIFVPVIGEIYGAIEGFQGFREAVKDYGAQDDAFELGLRTTEPSKVGILWGTVGLVAGGVPIAHSISSTARGFGQFETGVAGEATTLGRAETGAAAAQTGEVVAPQTDEVPTPGARDATEGIEGGDSAEIPTAAIDTQPPPDKLLLFHGTDQPGFTEGRINVAHAGGEHQDLSQGFYLTEDRELAEEYAHMRSKQRSVIPNVDERGLHGMTYTHGWDVALEDLGDVVDIRRGGQDRAAWDAFLEEPPFSVPIPGMPTRRIYLQKLGADRRGIVFEQFLGSVGKSDADVIVAPLGDDVFIGITTGQESTQVVIRSQKAADVLNAIIRTAQ